MTYLNGLNPRHGNRSAAMAKAVKGATKAQKNDYTVPKKSSIVAVQQLLEEGRDDGSLKCFFDALEVRLYCSWVPNSGLSAFSATSMRAHILFHTHVLSDNNHTMPKYHLWSYVSKYRTTTPLLPSYDFRSLPRHCTPHVRLTFAYNRYLRQRLSDYAKLKVDPIREKAQGTALVDTIDPLDLAPSSSVLLDHAQCVIGQIRLILDCIFNPELLRLPVFQCCYSLLSSDLGLLFQFLNYAILYALQNFFSLARPDAERTLFIFKEFTQLNLTEDILEFVAQGPNHVTKEQTEIPQALRQSKSSLKELTKALESYLFCRPSSVYGSNSLHKSASSLPRRISQRTLKTPLPAPVEKESSSASSPNPSLSKVPLKYQRSTPTLRPSGSASPPPDPNKPLPGPPRYPLNGTHASPSKHASPIMHASPSKHASPIMHTSPSTDGKPSSPSATYASTSAPAPPQLVVPTMSSKRTSAIFSMAGSPVRSSKPTQPLNVDKRAQSAYSPSSYMQTPPLRTASAASTESVNRRSVSNSTSVTSNCTSATSGSINTLGSALSTTSESVTSPPQSLASSSVYSESIQSNPATPVEPVYSTANNDSTSGQNDLYRPRGLGISHEHSLSSSTDDTAKGGSEYTYSSSSAGMSTSICDPGSTHVASSSSGASGSDWDDVLGSFLTDNETPSLELLDASKLKSKSLSNLRSLATPPESPKSHHQGLHTKTLNMFRSFKKNVHNIYD